MTAPDPHWRDAPITPGNWQFAPEPAGSAATFAGGQFSMRCDAARHVVTLLRAIPHATGPAQISIITGQGVRTLTAAPGSGSITATVDARDPLLDAMAFSRGRFVVAVPGGPTIYVPSWTEVSRVVEDCR